MFDIRVLARASPLATTTLLPCSLKGFERKEEVLSFPDRVSSNRKDQWSQSHLLPIPLATLAMVNNGE
jgi:hypothetical protein